MTEDLTESAEYRFFLEQTAQLVSHIEQEFITLASRLYLIREKAWWRGTYDSFQEYLEYAGITKTTASKLISVYEAYVVRGGAVAETLYGASYSNLYDAIPLIANDGVSNTLIKVKTLTRGEIRQEVREEKHPDCLHPSPILICTDCNKRITPKGLTV